MESNEFDVRRTVVAVLERCSVCKHDYALEDTRIVEREGELWVVSICCSRCSAQSLVAAVVDGENAAVGAFGQSDRRAKADDTDGPVDVDDVLDMHRFLETFDGDFLALFSRRRKSQP